MAKARLRAQPLHQVRDHINVMKKISVIRVIKQRNASVVVRDFFYTLLVIGLMVLCYCGVCYSADHINTEQTNIEQANGDIRQETNMNIATLKEQILAHNVSISTFAKQIGPAANEVLAELSKHKDDKVRLIVMYCLRETGGDSALETLMDGLQDTNSQVRAAAVAGLFRNANASLASPLLKRISKIEDGYIRQQVALLIGKLGNPKNNMSPLISHCRYENDAVAKEGCIAALAKFGDEDAKKEFMLQLKRSHRRDRARYLEYCEYIHEIWLLEGLSEVLDDPDPMIRIGVDGLPDYPEYLRANDIAVNLIASLTEHKFTFDIAKNKNYNALEIDEVKRFLSKK